MEAGEEGGCGGLLPGVGLEELEAAGREGEAEALSKLAFCSIVQLTARASICVRLQEGTAKVLIWVGLELTADAVERLLSASCLNRNTPPPPLHATA